MKIIVGIFIVFSFLTFSVQAEDAKNASEEQTESSYWDSIKDNIAEKAKAAKDIAGNAKDNIAEKAKAVKEVAGDVKNNVTEQAKAAKEIAIIAKGNVAEKAKGLLTDTEELRFESVYKIPFWQNDAVFWSAIAVASAGAAAFTVYTAGTGAPAAGTGVSYVASQLVAGGGAGSYMSGLSTVGGWFGGNAITGAAILNATSAAALGAGGEAVAIKGISATAKLVLASATNFGDFGFMYLGLKEENQATQIIQIIPAGNFGTAKVEQFLTRLKDGKNSLTTTLDTNKEIQSQLNTSFTQAKETIVTEYKFQPDLKAKMLQNLTQLNELNNEVIEKQKIVEANNLSNDYNTIVQETREMIDNYLANKESSTKEIRSDAIMGTILLHTLGYKQDFVKYIKQFKAINQTESFLLYLKSVAYLFDKDFKLAKQYALQAMDSEPEAIEPIMILIMALEGLGQHQQAFELDILFQEKFDDGHYETPNSLITAYNLLGDIANNHKLPQTAAKFHKQVFDNMGYIFSDADEKAFICLKIANDYHMFGSKRQATEYYEKAISYVKDDSLKQEIKRFFEEEIKTQVVLN
ncbi:hypothetical protein QUF74_15085 [Candidatus Halobeggiatoa sp. HSG11]|nr:hypothetical protein [Candidatus Halobeggiatoa sp. HSG11]